MRVLVSGAHGLIGSALLPALETAGHQVTRLVRGRPGAGDVGWDIGAGTIDAGGLAGVDAVVHLAGAGLGERRWTEEQKAALQDSRLDGTRLLSQALAGLGQPPSVLVSGSAVGWYGNRGAEILDEDSEPGTGFLAELCRGWEAATGGAEEAGIRVVHLRSGIVQSARGGILARQLPLFRLGVGGRLGSGRQYLSWISIDDEVGAILHVLADASLRGPVNATSPDPVTNAEYTRALGRVLGRPTFMAVPAAALAVVLGQQMADEMALASQRVRPARLEASGYRFRHPALEEALRSALSAGSAP
ncbi:MAG: TIGR01777 family oxidoreductase [Acidimicrobiales bacterium]